MMHWTVDVGRFDLILETIEIDYRRNIAETKAFELWLGIQLLLNTLIISYYNVGLELVA